MNNVKSRYFDPDGTPRLRLSYCAYLDILGFQEISSDAFKQNQGDILLSKIHKVISSEATELIPEVDPSLIPDSHAKIFTDNIVLGQIMLGQIINSSDGEGEFGVVIFQVMLYQLQMALEGFFVRGGIAIGDLFIDDNIVIGPALEEAYSIEQSIARDPRIVLSNKVFKLMKKHIKYYGTPHISPQYSNILLDADGKPFLNYLSILFDDADLLEYEIWEYVLKHKQRIEDNLKKHRKNPVIWAKYQWLSNYHNFICDEYKDIQGFTEEHLVSPRLANRRPSRIFKPRTT